MGSAFKRNRPRDSHGIRTTKWKGRAGGTFFRCGSGLCFVGSRWSGNWRKSCVSIWTRKSKKDLRAVFRPRTRDAGLLRLGGWTQIQEECRDMRRTNLVDSFGQDVRYAARILAKSPVFHR